MAKLVIFGTGTFAKMAHWCFSRDSEHDVVGFTVNADRLTEESYLGLPVYPFEEIERYCPPDTFSLFVAVGYSKMNAIRAAKCAEAKARGFILPSYVSSRCTMLTDTPIGENCCIFEDNTIQPFVTIGNGVMIWSGCHIGHEVVIGDYCFVSSHAVIAGHTKIGERCFVGINATIHEYLTIAPETLVGAGAVIAKDTVPQGVYVPPRSVLLARSSDTFF